MVLTDGGTVASSISISQLGEVRREQHEIMVPSHLTQLTDGDGS